ncbi:hypothetical protein GWI33_003083 [Rhynchophorus ferrugineus]|uniref:Uncharacterized protein n=1 Tax=Rhynchophorus ferrugineus TaxID=354439 RepID=A0A834IJN2_RHYFE|nr:hypothetical protein GWI33_003083 [Rhynchophorus ferrugineus]
MDKNTPQERAEIVTIFIENSLPRKTTIYPLHANVRQYGMAADMPRSGRQRTSRNAENVALVRDSGAESQETSIWRRGFQLHISASSLR